MTALQEPRYLLELLPIRAAVVRLAPSEALPYWASGEFVSITRTVDELSIVCPENCVPDGTAAECGWSCLRVAGPLDFEQVGVIASLAEPLREAGIPIFVVSTYDTDYLLIKASRLEKSVAALRDAGHEVRPAMPSEA